MSKPGISIIVPAYNEEKYLPATLTALLRARDYLVAKRPCDIDLLVVDNESTDQTASIAAQMGARVIKESVHNIAKVRNTGAQNATGDVLVFVDADTLVPESFLVRIHEVMSDPQVQGGAVDLDYRPARLAIKFYLRFWRVLGLIMGMAQGAAQFYRRSAFAALGGFDSQIFMGEDVEFYWQLKKWASKTGGRTHFIRDIQVIPSCRRDDQWPLWRTLVLTNPLLIAFLKRRSSTWTAWYDGKTR